MADIAPIDKLKALFANGPDLLSLTIKEQRDGTEKIAMANPPADDIMVTTGTLGGVNGAWVETPCSVFDRVIFYIHGGAFVSGSVNSHLSLAGELARAASARVFAVDYRLAPESTFPDGLVDCLTAYKAVSLAPEVDEIAIAGDSAGGGLALAVIMAARDSAWRRPRAAVLFSPWADLTCSSKSYDTLQDKDPLLSRAFLQKMAALYLGDRDPREPSASPLFGDFQRLPPMLIQASDCEVLIDDAISIERSARDVGVHATLETWPKMVHAWQGYTGLLPEATEALQRAGEYLRSHWEEQ